MACSFVPPELLAIDVETANKQKGRICQIGIVKLVDTNISVILDELVNPKGNFLKEFTDNCHGITKEMVKLSGEFDAIYPKLHELLAHRFVFSWHTFDSTQINAACNRYNLSPIPVVWLDACQAARELWPQFDEFKLNFVARHFGIEFKHHHAASDAHACMEIMQQAIGEHSFARVFNASFYRSENRPEVIDVSLRYSSDESTTRRQATWVDRKAEDIAREGNPYGRFFGSIVVISGDFSFSREELADRAHEAGFRVKPDNHNVCQKTTYLVRGDNAGKTKFNRANELISEGFLLKVVTESQFTSILDDNPLQNS